MADPQVPQEDTSRGPRSRALPIGDSRALGLPPQQHHHDQEEHVQHDNKGYSEEKCVRCGWVMGHPPLNCNNDNTPHVFPSQTEVDERRLRETTDASVWAAEFAKVRPDVDQGLMIGWFANAMATAEDHARPPERSDVPPDDEYVILPRSALLMFFGEMALPPWHDHRGKLIGERVDCAPIASRISEWLDAHNLTGVVHAR